MNIDKWLIDDVAWTIRGFEKEFIHYSQLDEPEPSPYVRAAHAALIVAKKNFGVCFPIEQFIYYVEKGSFIDDDGTGEWVNYNGDSLGYIHCNSTWLKTHKPKEAEFIMWYNK